MQILTDKIEHISSYILACMLEINAKQVYFFKRPCVKLRSKKFYFGVNYFFEHFGHLSIFFSNTLKIRLKTGNLG
jgi:hypothetical protein